MEGDGGHDGVMETAFGVEHKDETTHTHQTMVEGESAGERGEDESSEPEAEESGADPLARYFGGEDDEDDDEDDDYNGEDDGNSRRYGLAALAGDDLDSDDSESDEDYCPDAPSIRVGEEYQAVAPELQDSQEKANDVQVCHVHGTLLWTPCDDPSINEQVEPYVKFALSRSAYGGGWRPEYALSVLTQCNNDFKAAVKILLQPATEEIADKFQIRAWGPDEAERFERGCDKYGKLFDKIQKEIIRKSTKDCVEYYYKQWKKGRPNQYRVYCKNRRRYLENKLSHSPIHSPVVAEECPECGAKREAEPHPVFYEHEPHADDRLTCSTCGKHIERQKRYRSDSLISQDHAQHLFAPKPGTEGDGSDAESTYSAAKRHLEEDERLGDDTPKKLKLTQESADSTAIPYAGDQPIVNLIRAEKSCEKPLGTLPDGIQVVVESDEQRSSYVVTTRDFKQGEYVCLFDGELCSDLHGIWRYHNVAGDSTEKRPLLRFHHDGGYYWMDASSPEPIVRVMQSTRARDEADLQPKCLQVNGVNVVYLEALRDIPSGRRLIWWQEADIPTWEERPVAPVPIVVHDGQAFDNGFDFPFVEWGTQEELLQNITEEVLKHSPLLAAAVADPSLFPSAEHILQLGPGMGLPNIQENEHQRHIF